jgi:hypothetical protein
MGRHGGRGARMDCLGGMELEWIIIFRVELEWIVMVWVDLEWIIMLVVELE